MTAVFLCSAQSHHQYAQKKARIGAVHELGDRTLSIENRTRPVRMRQQRCPSRWGFSGQTGVTMSTGIHWTIKGAAVAAALALAACSKPPTVETFTISETAVRPPPSFEATIQTDTVVELAFAIAGTVEAITAEPDKPIKAGDPIARLDPTPVQVAIRDAEADLQSATDALAAKESDIERLKLIDESAEESAKAQMELEALKVRVEQSEAGLADTRAMLADTMIAAPFDGVAVGVSAEPFNEVGSGETVATVYAWEGLRADFQVLETNTDQITVGDSVSIAVSPISATVEGLVTEIAGVATSDTGAFAARATPSELPDTVRAGMSAVVTLIEAGPPEVIGVVVPASAVQAGADGGESFVFKYDSEAEKVTKTSVEVTETDDKNIVVGVGLEIGDRVVISDSSALSDGETVTVATN